MKIGVVFVAVHLSRKEAAHIHESPLGKQIMMLHTPTHAPLLFTMKLKSHMIAIQHGYSTMEFTL